MSKKKPSTELTVVERAKQALATTVHTEEQLATLAKATETITEITNQAGREQVHTARMLLKNTRCTIQNAGKDARDDAQKFSKAVIAEQNRLVALIEPEEGRLERLQEDWDDAREREKQAAIEAEVARVDAIQARIAAIRGSLGSAATCSSAVIQEHINSVERIDIDGSFQELYEAAFDAKLVTLVQLSHMHQAAVAREVDQEQVRKDREELEQLRARQDAIKAEEDRLAAERAEFERQQAAARYVPPQRQPAAWFRDNEVTRDLLSLTGEGQCVPLSAIEQWTDEQCKQAEEWAGAAHLHASDNDDVIVPPIPTHVAVWDTPAQRERLYRVEVWERRLGDSAELPPAETIVLQTPRPTDAEIIAMIASHWGVSEARAIEWVLCLDLSAQMTEVA